MNLNERIKAFKLRVWEVIGKNYNEYSKETLTAFSDYWTEHNEPVTHNTKMRFEREKVFQISRRLQTWKNNNSKWEKKTNGKIFISYYDKKYASKMKPEEHQRYKMHLETLGYVFGGNERGLWVKPPNKERLWI